MVPEEEWPECRKAFSSIAAKNPDNNAVDTAQIYLDKVTYWDNLRDESKRDAAFRKHILAEKAIILKDINEVKTFLTSHIAESPYNWYGSMAVKTRLEQLAQSKYDSFGYQEAFSVIDNMSADKVKQYLKELIKNNMTVGIEIIKYK